MRTLPETVFPASIELPDVCDALYIFILAECEFLLSASAAIKACAVSVHVCRDLQPAAARTDHLFPHETQSDSASLYALLVMHNPLAIGKAAE